MDSYAVIGGEGFVGGALIAELLRRHGPARVASLGLTQRTFSPDYRFFHTDITSSSSVYDSIKKSGATTVFHTASPHIHADRKTFESVNVEGTRAILDACVKAGVRKLVFTSTVTVVYEGKNLINVDERLPYAQAKDDHYVATKILAERMILEANGKDGLLTCSIRPSGIIGPGDRQVLPGIIGVVKSHQTSFQIGDNLNLFDFVHIRNVVHAHLLAADKLADPPIPFSTFQSRSKPVFGTVTRRKLPTSLSEDPSRAPSDTPLPAARNRYDQYHDPSSAPRSAAGEAFYITNGEPIAFWSLMRIGFHEYNGHLAPWKIVMSATMGKMLAVLVEIAMRMLGRNPEEGGFTRARVSYVVNNMYFNIDKARLVLGYEPVISLEDGFRDAIQWLQNDEKLKTKKVKS